MSDVIRIAISDYLKRYSKPGTHGTGGNVNITWDPNLHIN